MITKLDLRVVAGELRDLVSNKMSVYMMKKIRLQTNGKTEITMRMVGSRYPT
jgi:hypothetical protein